MLSNILEIENYEFKHVKQQPRVLIMMYFIAIAADVLYINCSSYYAIKFEGNSIIKIIKVINVIIKVIIKVVVIESKQK